MDFTPPCHDVMVNDSLYAKPLFEPMPSMPTASLLVRFVDLPYCVKTVKTSFCDRPGPKSRIFRLGSTSVGMVTLMGTSPLPDMRCASHAFAEYSRRTARILSE